jgi:hypothetical protein
MLNFSDKLIDSCLKDIIEISKFFISGKSSQKRHSSVGKAATRDADNMESIEEYNHTSL